MSFYFCFSPCRFWWIWEQTTNVWKMKMEHWSESSANSPNRLTDTTSRESPLPLHPSIHPPPPPTFFHTFLSVPKSWEGGEQKQIFIHEHYRTWSLCMNSWHVSVVPFLIVRFFCPQCVRRDSILHTECIHASLIHFPLSTRNRLGLKAPTLYFFYFILWTHSQSFHPLKKTKCF